jgi:hypothetical protein
VGTPSTGPPDGHQNGPSTNRAPRAGKRPNPNDDQNSNKRTRTGDPIPPSTITTSAGCRLTRGEVWVWMEEGRCFGCGGPPSDRLPGLGKAPAPA